ncbi:hypothetical protein [Pseudofrankia sp. BMG5.36]|uniref:hypothetical protein n=1 Tax=Pseudofrankia sp. BMG5.36 TaxID=1834512 RepID=UPI0008DA9DD9|nr:hypothetical protein [Pseudofrankia sp. BMG5.36]OHV49327.1 hypothetical protein BCD48_12780 [Pseudofrankia sp. BMG5.36]
MARPDPVPCPDHPRCGRPWTWQVTAPAHGLDPAHVKDGGPVRSALTCDHHLSETTRWARPAGQPAITAIPPAR